MLTNEQIAVLVLDKVKCSNSLAEDVIDIAIISIIAWSATKKAFDKTDNKYNFYIDVDDIINEISHMDSNEMINGFLEVKTNENND